MLDLNSICACLAEAFPCDSQQAAMLSAHCLTLYANLRCAFPLDIQQAAPISIRLRTSCFTCLRHLSYQGSQENSFEFEFIRIRPQMSCFDPGIGPPVATYAWISPAVRLSNCTFVVSQNDVSFCNPFAEGLRVVPGSTGKYQHVQAIIKTRGNTCREDTTTFGCRLG